MKTFWLAVIALLVVALAAACFSLTPSGGAEVCLRSGCLRADVAATPEERETGLMGQARPSPMLFAFPSPGVYRFWMKNTLVPLDIIWISDDRIVYIKVDAQPCGSGACETFGPGSPALYVLEVPAGFCSSNGIAEGQPVHVRWNGRAA